MRLACSPTTRQAGIAPRETYGLPPMGNNSNNNSNNSNNNNNNNSSSNDNNNDDNDKSHTPAGMA